MCASHHIRLQSFDFVGRSPVMDAGWSICIDLGKCEIVKELKSNLGPGYG